MAGQGQSGWDRLQTRLPGLNSIGVVLLNTSSLSVHDLFAKERQREMLEREVWLLLRKLPTSNFQSFVSVCSNGIVEHSSNRSDSDYDRLFSPSVQV